MNKTGMEMETGMEITERCCEPEPVSVYTCAKSLRYRVLLEIQCVIQQHPDMAMKRPVYIILLKWEARSVTAVGRIYKYGALPLKFTTSKWCCN